jgi:integrase
VTGKYPACTILAPEHRLIAAFELETGIRLTEQFHSRWDCLNSEQGILTIPLSKSGKTRHVILTDAALDIAKGLTSWMHSPFLFPSPLTSAQPMQGRHFVVKIYEPALKRAKSRESHGAPYAIPSRLRLSWLE